MEVSTAMMYWIGICFLAALGCIWLLWLAYGLFAKADTSDDSDARLRSICRNIARLDAKLEDFGYTTASAEALCRIKEDAEMESSINVTRWSNIKRRFKIIEDRLDALERAVGSKDQNK